VIDECVFVPDGSDLRPLYARSCRAPATCQGCSMCATHCLCSFTEDTPDDQVELVKEEPPGDFVDADALEEQVMSDIALLQDAGIRVDPNDVYSLPVRFNVEELPR
jgi:hypothetical protein